MKNQYDLCLEVLNRLQKAAILEKIIVIGSWCIYFYLVENTIELKFENLKLKLPHPAAFGLHKLIISSRRIKEEKRIKERKEALLILNTLIKKGEAKKVRGLFDSMPRRWKTKVMNALKESEAKNIIDILIYN